MTHLGRLLHVARSGVELFRQTGRRLLLGLPLFRAAGLKQDGISASGKCNTRFIKEHKPSNHIRARIKSHVYTTE